MAKYSYKYRPHFGFTGFLIEFFKGSEDADLLKDVLIALESIKPKAQPLVDLWMNGEVMIPFESNIGEFEISKDNYDMVFILGKESVTKMIHEILEANSNFLSLEVNFDDYHLKKI